MEPIDEIRLRAIEDRRLMSASPSESPWYRDGLAFECTRCGACCTGAPGYVWVSIEEIEQLARFQNQSVDEFSTRFVRQVGSRFSLIEKPGGDCIFWNKEMGCTVYAARPVQCRTWPFWPENVESEEDWDQVRSICPGSGRGQLFTIEQIQASIESVRE
jgi:Fe-S-cluster containining protein